MRVPHGSQTGAVWHRYGRPRCLAVPKMLKSRIWSCEARAAPIRFPHGLFTGCLWCLNRYGAHAWTYDFFQNSPWTAREQPVRGPGVWCDRGIIWSSWGCFTNISRALRNILSKFVQGLKLTLIPRSDFLLLLSKSWSKSDRHRSYFLSLKADIWLDWVAKLCS